MIKKVPMKRGKKNRASISALYSIKLLFTHLIKLESEFFYPSFDARYSVDSLRLYLTVQKYDTLVYEQRDSVLRFRLLVNRNSEYLGIRVTTIRQLDLFPHNHRHQESNCKGLDQQTKTNFHFITK